MGFFGTLGNVLSGRPIDGSVPVAKEQQAATGDEVPIVRVMRVESTIKGDRMQIFVTLRNESSMLIFLDKMRVCKVVKELDADLQPGLSHEYEVYNGPLLHDDRERDAELQYRNEAGKYFVARHEVRYKQQNDGLHVYEMRLLTPVQDL